MFLERVGEIGEGEQHQSLLARISQLKADSKFDGEHLISLQEAQVAIGAFHTIRVRFTFAYLCTIIFVLVGMAVLARDRFH